MIDAGANQGDLSRLFLQGQPNIEKLIIVETRDVHQSGLKTLNEGDSRIAIEQMALGSAPRQFTLYSYKLVAWYSCMKEMRLILAL